jgi:glucose-1-phosphate adenylyltransferase
VAILTLIMAGGEGTRLSALGLERPPAALPFAGKYRVVDFAMSNAVNSGLRRVAVLAERGRSALIDHLGAGEPWGLSRRRPDGLQIWQPAHGRHAPAMHCGSADGLYHQRQRIAHDDSDLLVVLCGDLVSIHDYRHLLRFHRERGADATVAVMQVRAGELPGFPRLAAGPDGHVTACGEGPGRPGSALAPVGVYVIGKSLLLQCLEEDHRDSRSSHHLGRDVIPKLLGHHAILAYPYGALADIGTLGAYWASNLGLLEDHAALDLYDPDWVIATRRAERPPVKFGVCGEVDTSILSDGCVIDGTVINSVLSPGVRVERGAIVRNSVVMSDATIRAGAQVDRCVLDEAVEIGVAAQVGAGDEQAPGARDPGNLNGGITVVGMHAQVPAGALIGRNCRIDPYVTAQALEQGELPSGATVSRGGARTT